MRLPAPNTSAPPAMAAPPAPTLAPPTSTLAPAQECSADIKQDAARLAASGHTGTGACVRTTPRQPDLGGNGGRASVAADICGGRSTKSRIGACIVVDGTVVVFLVPNGAIVGFIEYTISGLTTLNHHFLDWATSFHYQARFVSGSTAGAVVMDTFVYAEPVCITSCSVTSSGLIGGSALPGFRHSATAYYVSPLNGLKWNAQGGWKFYFANPFWFNKNTSPDITTPGPHRCDDALPGRPSGCVYDSIRPLHDIPAPRYPTYARHIQLAVHYYGMTDVLMRTQSSTIQDANRGVACPPGHPQPLPRENYSCDEYPFASTYNGAASAPDHGRNIFIFNFQTNYMFNCNASWLPRRMLGDRAGYSVCMIPLWENTLGGSDLGNFYYTSRVLDGDEFQVRVVG
ncbi:MAG TPA: hypothetical protein VF062_26115 [Candidatus Limnocylindrales bacterium]